MRQFESVNFLDFARLLAAFSDRASHEEKVRLIFKVYDVDGDGAAQTILGIMAVADAACARTIIVHAPRSLQASMLAMPRRHLCHSHTNLRLTADALCHMLARKHTHTHRHTATTARACHATGIVSADDLAIMLRQLAGSSLTDDAISALVSRALAEAGGPAGSGLTLADFKAALPNGDLEGMRVTVPTEL